MEGGACTPCLLEYLERQGMGESGVGESWERNGVALSGSVVSRMQ